MLDISLDFDKILAHHSTLTIITPKPLINILCLQLILAYFSTQYMYEAYSRQYYN